MKKKVEFGMLKTGQKFRYERKLYMKDDISGGVSLTTGEWNDKIFDNTLVTPVKIKITVQK